ncbi:MAG: hypothetical protein PHD01_06515, partial [Geobacteraceae bacterium]|nr:hypothetical protein [Geobacteraceae bacterium]
NVCRGRIFGQGLATGSEDLSILWKRLVHALSATPESERDLSALWGFLSSSALRNAGSAAESLDDAVGNPTLASSFPILQAAVTIDERGAARVEESVRLGLAPARTYGELWRCSESVPKRTLRRLILAIAALTDGFEVAVDILGMLLHNAHSSGGLIDDELIQCGRDLVRFCIFEKPGNTIDYHLGELVTACFGGEGAVEATAVVCRKLQAAFSDYRSHSYDYRHLLESLFQMQPMTALDVFLGGPSEEHVESLWDNDFDQQNPVEMLSDDTLITWAQKDPGFRFIRLAAAITPFTMNNVDGGYEWKPIAFLIISLAPDKEKVLTKFGAHLMPWSWSGSRAEILERRRALLRNLFSYHDSDVSAWAREKDEELRQMAEKERRGERMSDESFE